MPRHSGVGGGAGGVTDHALLTNVLPDQHHVDDNDPTAGQKAALAGTSGVPGSANPYVTDADARNTNSRIPSAHVLDGALHTVSGLTIGHVLKAVGAAAAAFGQLLHSQLGSIGADDHHAQQHVLATEVGLGTDHAISGALGGQVMRADTATLARWNWLGHADLTSVTPNQHHADVHGSSKHTDAYEPTGAVAIHEGAADPHTPYQKESEKGVANGYASLDGTTKVPTAEMGTGVADVSKFLRGDRTWAVPTASIAISEADIPFTDGDTMRRVTVADAAVTPTSKIVGSTKRPDSADDSADSGYLYVPTIVRVGTGQFDLLVACLDWGFGDPVENPPNETIKYQYTVG